MLLAPKFREQVQEMGTEHSWRTLEVKFVRGINDEVPGRYCYHSDVDVPGNDSNSERGAPI